MDAARVASSLCFETGRRRARSAQAAPLTGTYFGRVEDELGMEVSVEVTQPKPLERVVPVETS